MKKHTKHRSGIEHPHGIDLTDEDLEYMYKVWEQIGEENRAKKEKIHKSVRQAVKKALGD